VADSHSLDLNLFGISHSRRDLYGGRLATAVPTVTLGNLANLLCPNHPAPFQSQKPPLECRSNPLGRTFGRPEFMMFVGGAATAWPHAMHAQEAVRIYRLGVMIPSPKSHRTSQRLTRSPVDIEHRRCAVGTRVSQRQIRRET
jgi:hypothetical protein